MSAPDHTDLQAALDAEHAQRLALQHHAADQAQRVADLEAEIERITEAGRAHIRRAAALESERDRSARLFSELSCEYEALQDERDAALAELERVQARGWPSTPDDVRALFARPAPAAASDHCEDALEMVCATSGPGGFPKGGAA